MINKLPENWVAPVLVGEEFRGESGRWHGNFRCYCGKMFEAIEKNVRSGSTKSCSCLRGPKSKIKHGYSCTSIHYVWGSMLQRCTNPNHQQYINYGGRGIIVCDEWFTFENFLADMGEAPEGMSLDRIDNNLGYYKENCRWATRREQENNKRNNVIIQWIDGTTMTAAEWGRELHVVDSTLRNRKYAGYSDEEILRPEIERENWKSKT